MSWSDLRGCLLLGLAGGLMGFGVGGDLTSVAIGASIGLLVIPVLSVLS